MKGVASHFIHEIKRSFANLFHAWLQPFLCSSLLCVSQLTACINTQWEFELLSDSCLVWLFCNDVFSLVQDNGVKI